MENKENLPEIKELSSVPTIESYANNLQQKLQMCKLLRESGFAPASFKTDGAVLSAILFGQELSFSPIQSLQCIEIIQGKPTVNAAGMKAKILAEGGVIRDLEWTDKICRIEGNRSGNKVVTEYTMQEATQAGLSGKDNWKRMPKDMLYARCITRYARNHWADKIKGLYGTEEMRDAVIIQEPQTESVKQIIEAQVSPVSEPPIDLPIADSELWTGNEIIRGGKYAGKAWKEMTTHYLEFIITSDKAKQETRQYATLELARRQKAEQPDFEAINQQATDFDSDELPTFNN